MVATILLPLDASALAGQALPYATFLARASGARLILLHAVSGDSQPRRTDTAITTVLEQADLAAALRADGVQASSEVGHGPVGAAIARAARTLGADLIVMSTHGRGEIGRAIHGSVAEEVLRRCPVPLLLVTPSCHRQWATGRAFRVLVPLDSSELAERALAPARALAATVGGQAALLQVVEQQWEIDGLGFGHMLPVSPKDESAAWSYLQGVASRLAQTGLSVEQHVTAGDPASAIARQAIDLDVDLVVMATHGRGGLGRFVVERLAVVAMGGLTHLRLGSVADAVIRHLTTPVMLIGAANQPRAT